MPLVNIHLSKGTSKEYRSKLSSCIHESLIKTWMIPKDDKFHIFHEHEQSNFIIDKVIWNANRSDNVIVLQINSSFRTKEMKLNFYKDITEELGTKLGMSPDDIIINIVICDNENWSFGNGRAQLLE